MRTLNVFNQITVDGRFTSATSDIGWAHKDANDAEWNTFVDGNASGGGALVFGRITYDMMASYWPTPLAHNNAPVVADRMNAMPKIVFSRTLREAPWANTTIVRGDLITEVRKLKQQAGPDMTILGSGSIIAQLAPEKLIDAYQFVVNPIALGAGRTMFDGMPAALPLKLTRMRTFANGSVVLWYEPAQ